MKRYGVIVGRTKVMTVYAEDEEDAREQAHDLLGTNSQRQRIRQRWRQQGSRLKELRSFAASDPDRVQIEELDTDA